MMNSKKIRKPASLDETLVISQEEIQYDILAGKPASHAAGATFR